jgi:hypothetical protein
MAEGNEMELIKLCPACKEENPVSEVICRVCMTNISLVSPTPREERTVVRSDSDTPSLTLSRVSDRRTVLVPSGGVLGRSGEDTAFFRGDRTVSRRHAIVNFHEGEWWIEDLDSTNGTWVNGKRIASGCPHTLNEGDSVALSLACEMKVIK